MIKFSRRFKKVSYIYKEPKINNPNSKEIIGQASIRFARKQSYIGIWTLYLKIIPAGTYIYTLKKEAFMIGAIIGDLVGSVYEFNDFKQYDFPLVSKESRITDDSGCGKGHL